VITLDDYRSGANSLRDYDFSIHSEEERAEYLSISSAAAGQSILHEADSHDRFEQSS
jgi:hypothetical protein